VYIWNHQKYQNGAAIQHLAEKHLLRAEEILQLGSFVETSKSSFFVLTDHVLTATKPRVEGWLSAPGCDPMTVTVPMAARK
jgi:hypothetical protein